MLAIKLIKKEGKTMDITKQAQKKSVPTSLVSLAGGVGVVLEFKGLVSSFFSSSSFCSSEPWSSSSDSVFCQNEWYIFQIWYCFVRYKKIQQPLYYKSYCLLGWIQVPLSLFVVVLAWFSLDPIQAESFSNYIVSFSVVMIILRHLFLHHIRQTCLIICMYSLNAT